MRILLVSQYHPPEPNFKVGVLGAKLVNRGHRVTALTGFPTYPLGQVYEGYRQRPWRREVMDGVEVARVPLYPDHSRRVAKRALNYLSFAASATALGPFLAGRPDVVWVYHPPLTAVAPALWAATLHRAPLVVDVQDLWPETLVSSGLAPGSRVPGWVGRAASWVYRRAAALVVISEGFKRNLVAKGVPAEKIHVFHTWADESVYRPVEPDPALAAEHGMAGRFNVVFGGNIGPAQGLEVVLDAAERLADLPDVQFVVIGSGIDLSALEEGARSRGLSNVRFVGRQPEKRMPAFFALADALLIHLKRDPLFEITVPSKTFAYLACGRPILCGVSGDAAHVVEDAGAGMTFTPGDGAALAAAVRSLHAAPAEARARLGAAGRRAFLENYTSEVQMDRYEALFSTLARREVSR